MSASRWNWFSPAHFKSCQTTDRQVIAVNVGSGLATLVQVGLEEKVRQQKQEGSQNRSAQVRRLAFVHNGQQCSNWNSQLCQPQSTSWVSKARETWIEFLTYKLPAHFYKLKESKSSQWSTYSSWSSSKDFNGSTADTALHSASMSTSQYQAWTVSVFFWSI